MRLSTEQVQAIRQTARRVLGDRARVSVFGSRALDDRKGGDIDLLFETDAQLDNRANVICQLTGALTLALGDRKVDVLLKDANTPPAPVFDIAKRKPFNIEYHYNTLGSTLGYYGVGPGPYLFLPLGSPIGTGPTTLRDMVDWPQGLLLSKYIEEKQ